MKWFNKAMSGLMAVLMLLSVAVVPIPAFAAENWPEDDLSVYVDALPLMEEVADKLDESERVSAGSYDVTAGADIDLNTDFTNICFNADKVGSGFDGHITYCHCSPAYRLLTCFLILVLPCG